jgi:hypothetical protein
MSTNFYASPAAYATRANLRLVVQFQRRAVLREPPVRTFWQILRTQGAYASSRTLKRDAMDAQAVRDEHHRRGRRSRGVLAPRRWRQVREALRTPADDGGKKARFPRESTKDTVKTVAQGRPDVRPNLWCLPPAFSFAGRPWVGPAPGLPCALSISRARTMQKLGRVSAAGTCLCARCLKFKSERVSCNLRDTRKIPGVGECR